jgi:hypothetical protein
VAYGERLREALRRLFGVIHRREQLDKVTGACRNSGAREGPDR